LETPGISTGYWKARKTPFCARTSGSISSRSWPLYVTDPPVTVYAGCPASTCASVLFPDPFGPITACTSPGFTVRLMPRRISLSLTVARRSLISSMIYLKKRKSTLVNCDCDCDCNCNIHREAVRQ
jgi:hypothetical protein